MALEIERRTVEVEELVGDEYAQALLRAEALAPGAGREAVEPLLAEAWVRVGNVEVQAERVVVEGSAACQAVYRQGEATELRAVVAQASLSQVIELPGAGPDMQCRVRATVEHVEARYENGHIVFQVTCGLRVLVMKLSGAEVIAGVSGQEGLETCFRDLDTVKLAAEAEATATLEEQVALPAAVDARATLMDWAAVLVDSAEPDLGGVRVQGRAMVETVLASGVEGRPALLVRYPVPFDQVVSLPEWLTGDVFAEAELQTVESRIVPSEAEGSDGGLACTVTLRLRVLANGKESFRALGDIYATQGDALEVTRGPLTLCVSARQERIAETVRGTLLLGENAPGVGTVIATLARPVLGERRTEDGRGRLEGVLEAEVLYMPGGSELPAATRGELPFALELPFPLDDDALVEVQVVSAEANALMSDRLELKAQMAVCCERRQRQTVELVREIETGAPIQRRPGIVICWPEPGETPWQLGRRYAIPAASAAEAEPGRPLVLRG